MPRVIGIDLGTTRSRVAVMKDGNPVVIPNSAGELSTPSVVAFTQNGDRLVGQDAKQQAITNPTKTISSIKRFMGRRLDEVDTKIPEVPYAITSDNNGLVSVQIDDKTYTSPHISAMVLQKMKQIAEDYFGEAIKDAVITVPAYFNDAQRQATKEAGKIAGLDVLRIVNDPTAASLAYGRKIKEKKTIAVYDLGGGTFDISILELGDGICEVKSTNGDTHLGGDDFDQRVIDFLAEKFLKENSVDLRQDPMALQRLKEAAEKAKCELSSSASTYINLPSITANASDPSTSNHLNANLSRARFEQLVDDLVQRTKQPCEQAIRDAGLSASDIDEVILVGGSTRIPKVQELVQDVFGKEPNREVNLDEVVAIGVGMLSGDVTAHQLREVLPLSLGIETLGGVMSPIVERNTTIPSKKIEVFSTAADNQPSVEIHVLQGESDMAIDNRSIGRFHLDGIPPAPRGVPLIEVTFDIDANGILNVSAKDRGTGKEQNIRIEDSSGLSDSEIDKMVSDAQANAAENKKKREAVETKNAAEQQMHQTEKQMEEIGDKVSQKIKVKLTEAIDKVKDALEEDNIDAIKAANENLTQIWHQISNELYSTSPQEGFIKKIKTKIKEFFQ